NRSGGHADSGPVRRSGTRPREHRRGAPSPIGARREGPRARGTGDDRGWEGAQMKTEPATRIDSDPRERPLAVETVAEAYLALLRSRGVERLYLNAGTDFAPIAEAYGRLQTDGSTPFPLPVIATHENLAIGMAHGAYLMTGRPQAVMFHVSVGTANAVCGVMN